MAMTRYTPAHFLKRPGVNVITTYLRLKLKNAVFLEKNNVLFIFFELIAVFLVKVANILAKVVLGPKRLQHRTLSPFFSLSTARLAAITNGTCAPSSNNGLHVDRPQSFRNRFYETSLRPRL
jgi:hypothetical protein